MRRWLARRLSLLVPASILLALGWLPVGALARRFPFAAEISERKLASAFRMNHRQRVHTGAADGLDPPLAVVGDLNVAGDLRFPSPMGRAAGPMIDPPLLGPTGPTGYAAYQGIGCSGEAEVHETDAFGGCGGSVAALSSVSCAAATSCEAVGTVGTSQVVSGALGEGWSGTSWTIQPPPPPGTLTGVSCNSTTACMAVGYEYSSGAGGYVPAAETWDGSSWTIRPPPIPSNATDALFAYVQCATANACMAVGSYTTTVSDSRPLIEFWNGLVWTIQAASLPSGAYGGWLYGVSCPSDNTCTAVGSYYPTTGSAGYLALAESWNGSSWSVQPTPNPVSTTTSYILNAVWCLSAESCNAVGNSFTGSGAETLAESWDGTSWSIQPTPNPSASADGDFANLSCAPKGVPCKAVGYSSSNETLVESWDGTSWSIDNTPQIPNATQSSFSDVSCTSERACTAVGSYFNDSVSGELALAERWDGTNWTIEQTTDPPVVETGSATNIAGPSATMNGTVWPDGATVTNCYFEYGTSYPYTATVPCAQAVGAGTFPVSVSGDLSGLTPNTTYYVVLVATNAAGTATDEFGSSFTTSSGSPAGGGGGGNSGGPVGCIGTSCGTVSFGGCVAPKPKCPPPRPQGVVCSGGSCFDGAYDQVLHATVGGIYARVRNYSPWVETGPGSYSVSAWVALQDCTKPGSGGCNGEELAQIGWRERPYGQRDTLVESNFPGPALVSDCNPQAVGSTVGTGTLTCNSVPTPAQPELYTYYTVLYGYEPGRFTFYVNGQKVASGPAKFVPHQADVIGETKLASDQMPGDANDPEIFEDIHVFVNGAWQPFTAKPLSTTNYSGYQPPVSPSQQETCLGIWDTAYGDASAVVRSICGSGAQAAAQAATVSIQASQHVRSSAVIPLSCPAGDVACSGTVSLEQAPGAGHLARVSARSPQVAKPTAFSLPPGGRERLRVRLAHSALRKLKSTGRLRVRVVLTRSGTGGRAIHATSRSFVLLS